MGKMDVAERAREALASFAPYETRAGPHHRVAPPHDVDRADQIPDFRVRPGEIRKDEIGPSLPIRVEQALAFFRGRRTRQGIVIGQDRFILPVVRLWCVATT